MIKFLALALAASPASAAECDATVAIYAMLAGRFDEAQISTGLTLNGVTIETWANPATGSWTIIATDGRGVSCLLAAGSAFSTGNPA